MKLEMVHFGKPFCLVLSAFFILVIPGVCGQEACPSFCKFRLCHITFRRGTELQKENRGLMLGIPFSPLGPFSCVQRKRGVVKRLFRVTGGEARVSKKSVNNFVPISQFRKSEVSPRFKKDYLRWQLDDKNESSIARARPMGNQDEILDRMCVQLPITSYFTSRGRLVRPKGKKACVGFRTVMPLLLVDFEWDSPDDFDLTLEEPNGDVINRFGANLSSKNGGTLTLDNASGVCTGPFGIERIAYSRSDVVDEGRYIIRVDHNRLCETITRFKLRVWYNGRTILDERRTITRNKTGPDAVVGAFTI